jgi:hypothetical protein
VLVGQIASLFSRLLPNKLAVQLKRAIIELQPNDLACRTSRVGLTPCSPNLERTRIDNPHVDGMLLGQVVKDNVVRVTDLHSPGRETVKECRKFLGRRGS